MKNNSLTCVVDFSAGKMLKLGFFAGVGMFVAKTVCITLLGKLAVGTAIKGIKGTAVKTFNKAYDDVKDVVEDRLSELDPETMDKISELLTKLDEDIKKMDKQNEEENDAEEETGEDK